jgi:aminopeptidase-like protein
MSDVISERSTPPMHDWATDLFPINRSLTGPGVRQTLDYLKNLLPSLTLASIQSGSQVFDWTVPKEWQLRDAYVADQAGRRVIDFASSNLHVVGYSVPFEGWLKLEQLQNHLYSLPDMPDAIPYVRV